MTVLGADPLLLIQGEVYLSEGSSRLGLLPRREENQSQNEERVGERPVYSYLPVIESVALKT